MKKPIIFIHLFVFSTFLVIGIIGLAQAKDRAEVVHWWVSGGEAAAMQVVIQKFEKQGYTWIDTPVKASYQAKSVAISRMLDGTPPTLVQWHAGIALKELYDEGLIRDLTPLVQKYNWQKAIPQVLLEQISVDGKIVAIPMTLHGSNWLWANKKVFEQTGNPIPADWQEFLNIAPKLQKEGYIPLALGAQPWQIRLLFNNVLLSVGGSSLYEEVMINHNPVAIESEAMANVFSVFGKLRQYTDENNTDRSWSETTKLVIEGKAALQIMGDWAKGEFSQAGQVPEKEFICEFSPGTQNRYLIVTDVFVAPATTKAEDLAMQEKLISIMMDTETQREFNLSKGSIPTRVDVSTKGFDSCSTKAMKAVAGGAKIIPGFNMTNKGLISNVLMDSISKYWQSEELSPEQAAEDLAKAIRQASI